MTLPALLDPLVDPGTDCRGLPFMPLHTTRLLDSDFLALSTGDEFKAAAILWCRSWASVPASSLPDNDRILARWVSCSLKEWLAMREMVLRGFVKCADGLLYHPLLAESATRAWRASLIFRAKIDRRLSIEIGEWEILRAMVFERDDFTCQYCGDRGGRLECDHVHPVAQGGATSLDNLATACLPCNRSKGAKLLSQWSGRR